MRTKVMLFIGAFASVLAVRMFARAFLSPESGLNLSIMAGTLYTIFAFTATLRHALVIAAITIVWCASYFYFLDFRRDAVGFVVMAGIGILALLMVRSFKRRELQQAK